MTDDKAIHESADAATAGVAGVPPKKILAMPGSKLAWISVVLPVIGFGARLFMPILRVVRLPMSFFLFGFLIAGFVCVLVAIIRQKERSIVLAFPLIVGLLAVLWAGAEFVFPH